MKYYQRYIKIMPTDNKRNYPLSKLLFNWTGDEYEPLNFISTYNGHTPNECVKIFSNSLYKYTDKFIQTDNVIIINDYDDYIFRLKYDANTTFCGNELYDHTDGYTSYLTLGCQIREKSTPPNPFDLFETRQANKYRIETDYIKSKTKKEEIFIGLYTYNETTKSYEYLPNSFYDKKKQMYYLYQK